MPKKPFSLRSVTAGTQYLAFFVREILDGICPKRSGSVYIHYINGEDDEEVIDDEKKQDVEALNMFFDILS